MVQEQTRSAKVLQFPAGGRDGLKASSSAQSFTRETAIAVGGSWYHAEAIEDAQKGKTQ